MGFFEGLAPRWRAAAIGKPLTPLSRAIVAATQRGPVVGHFRLFRWVKRAKCVGMWVRSSAIRPVPAYAKVSEAALESVRQALAEDEEDAREQLDEAFERFEREQPCLAAHIGDILAETSEETALALGYFLVLTVWLAFDQAHGAQMEEVTAEAISATQELLELDEELRDSGPDEPLASDDIIAMEQPALIGFVHENLEAAAESHEGLEEEDLDKIYRVVLVQILVLSYAVTKPAGFPVGRAEAQA